MLILASLTSLAILFIASWVAFTTLPLILLAFLVIVSILSIIALTLAIIPNLAVIATPALPIALTIIAQISTVLLGGFLFKEMFVFALDKLSSVKGKADTEKISNHIKQITGMAIGCGISAALIFALPATAATIATIIIFVAGMICLNSVLINKIINPEKEGTETTVKKDKNQTKEEEKDKKTDKKKSDTIKKESEEEIKEKKAPTSTTATLDLEKNIENIDKEKKEGAEKGEKKELEPTTETEQNISITPLKEKTEEPTISTT